MKNLTPEFLESMKERIEINEQLKRYAKLMQQAYLVSLGRVEISKMQAEAARTFMLGFKTTIGRFVPELKAVEHSGNIGVGAAEAWQHALKRADQAQLPPGVEAHTQH